ncbi:MAG TPA: high-potential iron-sulfur protein [Rhizomicrobium sp.]|nr:high-potential iron-sulfur protein [Rhizomicrobium sp.]
MTESIKQITRQTFLSGVVVLPALAAISSVPAQADSSKSSKDAMHYQTTPSDGKQCSGCNFFMPGQDANADGTCQIVDGAISPHGYCMAFSAK